MEMFQATWVKIYTAWAESLSKVNPLWLSSILGGIAALAMPPFQAWYVLPFSFSGFLILFENTRSVRSAFGLGWVFGFGYFLGGLYWFANGPLTLEMWLAAPIAAVGLPLLLAFFPAAAAALTHKWTDTPLSRVFLFSCLWSAFEWVRGHILTGLPWNLVGYTWDTPMLQVTSIIGIYGLSALTVFAACVFASGRKLWITGAVLVISALAVWGDYRLTQNPIPPQSEMTGVNLRIVQASIPQQTKWLRQHFQDNLGRHVALSHLPAEKPLMAVIWPEASVTTFVEELPGLMKILAEAAPSGGLLIFGAPREEKGNLRTSMMALNQEGKRMGVYDKSHLVPFGEYMPFRSFLGFKKLTYGDQDYTPGPGIQTLTLPGLPKVSPLICYEAIFPHEVIDEKDRPSWMLNLTNDAWYGHSSGPYQHLQIVRVRSIEEGMPLVRSANNGISAVIDSFGRILYRLELDEIGFIDFSLPKPLTYATVYQRWGDLPFSGILVVFLGLAFAYCHYQKRHNLRNK